jgi:predicted GNAT family acetyltransferase
MRLRTFDSAGQFLRYVEPALLADEAENALILGVALRLQDGHTFGGEPPFLACAEDAGEVVTISARTPPHNLLIREEREDDTALELIVARLHGDGIKLPGVHGMRAAAARFADVWSGKAGVRSEIAMEQCLYRLTEVTVPTGAPGSFRAADPEDRDLLVAWVCAFVTEAVGGAPRQDPVGLVERLTRAAALGVWDDDGAVSMAAVSRPTPNGISISLVYTPPEKRGRGYASACVAALSERQLDSGKRFCTLFADLANPTSNALYQRIGYRPLAGFVEIHFHEE